MKTLLLVLGLAAFVPAQETRFVVMDVFADGGERALAAWQIEIECDSAKAKIVGVEGGPKTPYYDPAALQGGRIILASFTTEPSPAAGRVRVARVHFQESGTTSYSVKLMAAASPGGERFEPKFDLVRAGGK